MCESSPKVCRSAEQALIFALNVARARCHMCGRRLTRKTLGYLRIRAGALEAAVCVRCLEDVAYAASGGL